MKIIDSESFLDKSEHSQGGKYKVYRYRFVVLALYSLVTFLSALMATCMSSLTINLEKIYTLDIFVVNFGTSLIWFVLYPPMSFAANYILDVKGLKVTMLFGAATLLIGCWIRVLSEHSFYFIVAGQVIGAIGQPCLLNAPQKLSAVWFPSHERPLSTVLASLADPIGAGVGFVIGHMFVDNNAYSDDGRTQVKNLMIGVAVIGTIICLPSFFLFRDKPPTPPSKGAEAEKISYRDSFRILGRNINYLIFISAAGFSWASVNITSSLLTPILIPYGFTGSQAGGLGALTLACGIIGSFIWGVYVRKTKNYKKSLVICSAVAVAAAIASPILLYLKCTYIMVAVTILSGAFMIPLLPLSFELCGEISFPVVEGAAGGFMVLMIRLLSVGGILGVDALVHEDTVTNARYGQIVIAGMLTLGLIGYLLTKEELKRIRLEENSPRSSE